jgi:lipoprotein NlpI
VENKELIQAFNNYGNFCQQRRKYIAGRCAFQQALELDPDNPVIMSNLGAMYHELFEFDKAKALFDRAIELSPNYAAPYSNYGLLLNTINDHERSTKMFEKAIELEPDHTLHHWNLALNLLDSGQWERGFEEYEIRFKHIPKEYPQYTFPTWQGEDLSDKTIIVYEEQGHGDRILFTRFIHELKIRYPTSKIYFMCGQALFALFYEYQKAGVCELLPVSVIFPKADYGVYLMSLPKLLGCTDPENVPPDPGFIKYRCEFQKNTVGLSTILPKGKRVGLCWHGSISHAQDHMRSIPFEKLIPLMDNPYYSWYSLQADQFAQDIKTWCAQDLINNDSTEDFMKHGWTKTGVFMTNLDLVITVDTAIAHLAGALDIPVWLLVPKSSSWMWKRHGDKTAWYPSMTIFRQKEACNWDPVIEEVHEWLSKTAKDLRDTKG